MPSPFLLTQAAPNPQGALPAEPVGVPQAIPLWSKVERGIGDAADMVRQGAAEEVQRGLTSDLKRGAAAFAGGAYGGVAGAIRGLGAAADAVGRLEGDATPGSSRLLAPLAAPFERAAAGAEAQVQDPTLLEQGLGLAGGIVPAAVAATATGGAALPVIFGFQGADQAARDQEASRQPPSVGSALRVLGSGAFQGAASLIPGGALAEGLVPELANPLARAGARLAAGAAGQAGVGAVMQGGANLIEGKPVTRDLLSSAAQMAILHAATSAPGLASEALRAPEAATAPTDDAAPQAPPSPSPPAVIGRPVVDADFRPVAPPLALPSPDQFRGAAAELDHLGLEQQATGPLRSGSDYDAAAETLRTGDAPPDIEPAAEPEQLLDAAAGASGSGSAGSAPGVSIGSQATYRGRDIYAATFDPRALQTAPDVFQYKADGDAAGVTSRLRGVETWDPTSAGKSMVWQGPEGSYFVADGHQRLGLAMRLLDQGPTLDATLFRAADGWSPEDVRTVAALKNIREGSGTPLDAAKVLRGSASLNDDSLPVTGDFIHQAKGLARLSDEAFSAVVNKVVPERYAAQIGNMAGERTDLHSAMMNLLAKAKPANLDEARALVAESLDQDFLKREGVQADMFGGEPAESTVIARAKIKAAVLRQVRSDAKLFSTLTRQADAIEAGGNALARDANEAELATNRAAEALISKLAYRDGPIADAMREGAEAVTQGGTVADAARGVANEVRKSIRGVDRAQADRVVRLTPAPPTVDPLTTTKAFERPGDQGARDQMNSKPEDAEDERAANDGGPGFLGGLFDDIRADNPPRRAADALRGCAI